MSSYHLMYHISEPQDTGNFYHATYQYTEGRNEASLSQTIHRNNYEGMESLKLDTIRVMGMTRPVVSITVNLPDSNFLHEDWELLPSGELRVNKLQVPMHERATIVFSF